MTVVGLVGLLPVLDAHPVAGAGTSHAPVHMPNVIHFDRTTTFAAMANAGLYFRVNGPAGWNEVVAENPPPGTLVPWHSTVVLATTVASAPQSGSTIMPDVLYRTRSEVFAAMAHAGLYFTTRGPANWNIVVAQSPRPGTTVTVHSSVLVRTARVATTSPSGTTVMPNLVGRPRGAAFTAMARAGLYFAVSGPTDWNVVTGQSPAPGTRVAWHSSASLRVARVVSTTVARPTLVRVPALVGRARSAALTLLARDGLRAHPQGLGSTDGTWTSVVAQSPTPGTEVHRGTVVVLDTTRATAPTTTTSAPTTPGGTTPTTPPTTTTTHPVTTTTKPAASRTRIGIATWYAYIPGQCATWYLPRGTRITIEDLATGRTISCLVTDRQDYSPGRVVDLSETQFAELTPLWRGVVRVKVTW